MSSFRLTLLNSMSDGSRDRSPPIVLEGVQLLVESAAGVETDGEQVQHGRVSAGAIGVRVERSPAPLIRSISISMSLPINLPVAACRDAPKSSTAVIERQRSDYFPKLGPISSILDIVSAMGAACCQVACGAPNVDTTTMSNCFPQ